MLTQQEIERMFKEIGLGTEVERARFIKLAAWGTELDASREQIFIRTTTVTSIDGGDNNGELERNP